MDSNKRIKYKYKFEFERMKVEKYGSDNAFEIISEERRMVQDEKCENNLL